MVNVFGFEIPIDFGFSFGLSSFAWFLIFLIFIIVVGGGVGIFLMYRMKLYNKKIIVFENISGQGFQPTYRDKARIIKLGDGGEEILYLLKKKVYRTAYGKKMGKNTYWFAVGQDGYWYNVTLGDVDAKMGMLDIEPVDRDMRYMHVAIRKNIQDRYNKPSFMDKYGTQLFNGMFLLIMIVGIWFLLNQIAGISREIAVAVSTAKEIQVGSGQQLAALDRIVTTSNSGVVPAGDGG